MNFILFVIILCVAISIIKKRIKANQEKNQQALLYRKQQAEIRKAIRATEEAYKIITQAASALPFLKSTLPFSSYPDSFYDSITVKHIECMGSGYLDSVDVGKEYLVIAESLSDYTDEKKFAWNDSYRSALNLSESWSFRRSDRHSSSGSYDIYTEMYHTNHLLWHQFSEGFVSALKRAHPEWEILDSDDHIYIQTKKH